MIPAMIGQCVSPEPKFATGRRDDANDDDNVDDDDDDDDDDDKHDDDDDDDDDDDNDGSHLFVHRGPEMSKQGFRTR